MMKEKGTNTSDVICGKCLVPQAGAVWSRDLLPWRHPADPISPGRVRQALLAVRADPHHGRGCHLSRGHLHLLPGPHR